MRDGQLLEKQEIDKMYVIWREAELVHLISFQPPYSMRRGPRKIRCHMPSKPSRRSCIRDSDALEKATTAYALKKVWPELTLHIVPDAGHSARETGTAKLLVQVCVTFRVYVVLRVLTPSWNRLRMPLPTIERKV